MKVQEIMKAKELNLAERSFWPVCFVLIALLLGACGGGGGGGDGGRSTGTSFRIIHASVDSSPYSVSAGDKFLQKAAYADVTEYVPLDQGPVLLTVSRLNFPGDVLTQIASNTKESTEYSLFVFGEKRRGSFRTTMLEEPVVRPAKGQARVQLLNALPDHPRAVLTATGLKIGPVNYSTSSGYTEVASGPLAVSVGTEDGRVISSQTLLLPDQGEATVVVSGSADLNVRFVRVYYDLD